MHGFPFLSESDTYDSTRYATTSIPKKAPAPAPSADEPSPVVADQAEATNDSPKASEPVKDENLAFLQGLVDKYQEKTEKEIQRTLKVSSLSVCFLPGWSSVIIFSLSNMIDGWRRACLKLKLTKAF